MKALSMPISSPSRTESFPPPLMRFLRSNVGSRSSSRGRSRSSPVFYIRDKRSSDDVAEEPSSPKVTCIGQVRFPRSGGGGATKPRRRRWFVGNALFFARFSSRFCSRKRAFGRFISKWLLFLKAGYCRRVDAEEDHFRAPCKEKSENHGSEREKKKTSRPRNGLILTRCRSAPYRSSSLGGRFWNSPLSGKKSEESQRISKENSKKIENLINNNADNFNGILDFPVHPLMLERCKSEPARRGEQLDPETSFRWQTKSG